MIVVVAEVVVIGIGVVDVDIIVEVGDVEVVG